MATLVLKVILWQTQWTGSLFLYACPQGKGWGALRYISWTLLHLGAHVWLVFPNRDIEQALWKEERATGGSGQAGQ